MLNASGKPISESAHLVGVDHETELPGEARVYAGEGLPVRIETFVKSRKSDGLLKYMTAVKINSKVTITELDRWITQQEYLDLIRDIETRMIPEMEAALAGKKFNPPVVTAGEIFQSRMHDQ